MYKYDLNVSIFSGSNDLEGNVNSVSNSDKFNYIVNSYPSISLDVLSSSDVIVWDLDEDISQYREYIKKGCRIVMCADKYDDSFENMDAVIIRPVDSNYVNYILRKVIMSIEVEEDLSFSKSCFNAAIDAMPDMFWIKSLDGIHAALNSKFCEVVNKPREDITGKDHYYIWDVSRDDPNSGADLCKMSEDQVIEAGHMLTFHETVKVDTGVRQLVTYKAPLYDKLGRPIGTVGIGHDITDLKNLSVELGILLNSMPYPILLSDNSGIIQNVNPAFGDVFGVNTCEMLNKNYGEWARNTFDDNVSINTSGYTEFRLTVNGEEKQVELRTEEIRDVFDNVTGKVCIFRDVTAQRKLEEQIIKSSNIDFMTKLYNRRYLYKFISEQSSGSTISIISIDLDRFKSINDTYGHKTGDEAIILVSNILKDFFKEDVVIRMGGDEFLVVKVGSVDMTDLADEANTLLEILKIKLHEREEFKNLSASIGISQGTLEDNTLDELMKKSDDAMYSSKQNGRSCFTIYEGSNCTGKPYIKKRF